MQNFEDNQGSDSSVGDVQKLSIWMDFDLSSKLEIDNLLMCLSLIIEVKFIFYSKSKFCCGSISSYEPHKRAHL